MREIIRSVNHLHACQLLHNKFVVVLGDSIQRGVYKDLVLLLQKDKYLSNKQLKCKGEISFEQDCLVEGGCLKPMTNGTEYKEVRQFQSDHHLVRFYFLTRIFSSYMESIIEDFRHGLKPDVLIVNSCVWDISRYNSRWTEGYKNNLKKFFDELDSIFTEETLIIWNLTMPLGETIRGGFLVPEVEHKASQLRFDVVEANFLSGTLANCYKKDVLDLHFQFRLSLHHRTRDGVHWNPIAHRRITSLLLQHIAQAWGVILPSFLTTVSEETLSQAANRNDRDESGWNDLGCKGKNVNCRPWQEQYNFAQRASKVPIQSAPVQRPYQQEHPRSDHYSSAGNRHKRDENFLSFESRDMDYRPWRQDYYSDRSTISLAASVRGWQNPQEDNRHVSNYRPYRFEPYREDLRQYVIRNRFMRHNYNPYRPIHSRTYY